MNEIILHDQYQHYKRGYRYEVIGFARHSETYEEMIIYKALYSCDKWGQGAIWVRPKAMFLEEVEHEGKLVPRFKRIRTDAPQQA